MVGWWRLAWLLSPVAAATLKDPAIASSAAPLYFDDSWTLSSDKVSVAGTVPGDILTDLEAGGVIGDPLFETNFKDQAHLWANSTWDMSRSVPAQKVKEGVTQALVFDGVKMLAFASLGEAFLGNMTDQFLRYIFPLDPSLLSASTELRLTFPPSTPSYFDTHTLWC